MFFLLVLFISIWQFQLPIISSNFKGFFQPIYYQSVRVWYLLSACYWSFLPLLSHTSILTTGFPSFISTRHFPPLLFSDPLLLYFPSEKSRASNDINWTGNKKMQQTRYKPHSKVGQSNTVGEKGPKTD